MKVEPIEAPVTVSLVNEEGAVRRPRALDLLLLAALALLLPGMLVAPLPVVRIPLGLAFALFAPGYALTAALFPRRGDLAAGERTALSFGLSIAVIPVLALLLDALRWGILPLPIALSLTIWVVLLCAVATVRRRIIVPPDAAFAPLIFDRLIQWQAERSLIRSRVQIGVNVLGGLLVVAAIVLLLPGTTVQPTEFYILGNERQAEEYPRDAVRGDELTVTIGIVNGESDQRSYRVEVWVVDALGSAQRAKVAEDGPITLMAGQQWERPIAWRMPWVGNDQQVEFLLFAPDNTEPYRRLHLWLNVLEAPRL